MIPPITRRERLLLAAFVAAFLVYAIGGAILVSLLRDLTIGDPHGVAAHPGVAASPRDP